MLQYVPLREKSNFETTVPVAMHHLASEANTQHIASQERIRMILYR
jgi:hypothetical protein